MQGTYDRILGTTHDSLRPLGQDGYLTIDMHTGGEPLRVILSGIPSLQGRSVLVKRNEFRQKYDDLRRLLMYEPRGHADMYGCVLVEPERPDSDFGVIFMHNEGYSTMCGHAVIAITKLAAMLGWKDPDGNQVHLQMDVPCGMIESRIDLNRTDEFAITFTGVPSFVYRDDQVMELPGFGKIVYDIAFGGAFYAYVDADAMGLDLSLRNISSIIRIGQSMKGQILESGAAIDHPVEADLGFLYGVIFRSTIRTTNCDFRNVCVFANGEVDRSPTGSGVCGMLALLHHRNLITRDKTITIESIVGTRFQGKSIETIHYHGYDAIIPMVAGNAYLTGVHHFFRDPNDPIREGFLAR
jgi:proline racemase